MDSLSSRKTLGIQPVEDQKESDIGSPVRWPSVATSGGGSYSVWSENEGVTEKVPSSRALEAG